MDKLIFLGTGHGGTFDLYNTCFLIKNNDKNFLIDTGGSIEIIKRLKLKNIDLGDINNIFISHNHTDHILGMVWMFKLLSLKFMHGEIKEKINIYCNDVVNEALTEVSKYLLPEKLISIINENINFIILEDDSKYVINDVQYNFFDIHSKSTKQYGFECVLNKKRVVFLGDETLKPIVENRVLNADYVMHEAFCLDSEENIFHAYEKNHSTVLSASKVMNNLNVKNLILYHTEESHGIERKRLYEAEAKTVFNGNVIVPDDMEEIII